MKGIVFYLKVLLFFVVALSTYGEQKVSALSLRSPCDYPGGKECPGGKYGYIDKTGDIIIPLQFREAHSFSEGLAAVEINSRWGYIDKTGKIVVPAHFTGVLDFSEGLAAVAINGAWGYIDKMGTIIIELKSEEVRSFHEGLAAVDVNEKWGYIDKAGKMIIKPQFYGAYDFSEGLACIETDSGEYGYINKEGEIIIKPEYWLANNFSEGLAVVCKKNKDCVYIDKAGQKVFDKKFHFAHSFYEGLAVIEGTWVSEDKYEYGYGYIDKSGKLTILPSQFFGVRHFSEGYAFIKTEWDSSGYKSGYIDKTGKLVTKLKHHFVEDLVDDCSMSDSSEGLGDFSEGLAVTKEGYIDKTGNIAIPIGTLDVIFDFHDGLAMVAICEKLSGIRRSWD